MRPSTIRRQPRVYDKTNIAILYGYWALLLLHTVHHRSYISLGNTNARWSKRSRWEQLAANGSLQQSKSSNWGRTKTRRRPFHQGRKMLLDKSEVSRQPRYFSCFSRQAINERQQPTLPIVFSPPRSALHVPTHTSCDTVPAHLFERLGK